MKQILWITEILIDPVRGIYLQTLYWSDGSVEERRVPKGPIIFPVNGATGWNGWMSSRPSWFINLRGNVSMPILQKSW